MNLTWAKRDKLRWYPFGVFGGVNLEDKAFDNLSGVFCVFSASTRFIPTARPPIQPAYQTIYVGTGDIRKRISALRVERSIKRHGPQSVTWAEVPEDLQAGVAAYLADKLDPAERDTNPEIERLQVNLPYTP
jgi:hypothetical protein